ncbi:dethiobiotin synthase [Vulgatibacter sp.]|uniref:dethiobiotin synthase n=1 Tax=Vulgatibacter sp. TaxID=1971226 RepID=UPI003563594C
MPGLLVTATDTGVGKTAVAASLIAAARAAGLDVGGMKPAESGCARDASGALLPADALLLQAAAGGGDPLDLVCPWRLEAALAPGIAAALEGVEVELDRIESSYRQLAARHPGGVIVEGAGGLLVPLDPAFHTVADLALRLELPVVVVARASLGTINHTALTVEALATRGIECRGVILNAASPDVENAAAGNARAIERLADVPVLASLPWLGEMTPMQRVERLAAELGRKLDLPRMLS